MEHLIAAHSVAERRPEIAGALRAHAARKPVNAAAATAVAAGAADLLLAWVYANGSVPSLPVWVSPSDTVASLGIEGVEWWPSREAFLRAHAPSLLRLAWPSSSTFASAPPHEVRDAATSAAADIGLLEGWRFSVDRGWKGSRSLWVCWTAAGAGALVCMETKGGGVNARRFLPGPGSTEASRSWPVCPDVPDVEAAVRRWAAEALRAAPSAVVRVEGQG